jgi:hypothetical protein
MSMARIRNRLYCAFWNVRHGAFIWLTQHAPFKPVDCEECPAGRSASGEWGHEEWCGVYGQDCPNKPCQLPPEWLNAYAERIENERGEQMGRFADWIAEQERMCDAGGGASRNDKRGVERLDDGGRTRYS